MTRLLTALLLTLALPLQAATLKIATVAPDGTGWMQEMRAGAKEIERRTEGRVKFRFYPGGVMGDDQSVLRKIRIGQLHGGVLTGGGASLIHPDAALYSLPFAFNDYTEVDHVRSTMDGELVAALKEKGFVSFGLTEGGFAYFLSNEPIATVAELRKRKVWVPEGDRVNRATLEAIGVAPISLPLTDVLTGLQTGLVDTVATSPIGAIALQWHTRVKYMVDAPLVYLYATMVVRDRVFDRLSKGDQAVVREVMSGVFERLNRQNRIDNESARDGLAAQGISIVEPQERASQWQEAIDASLRRVVEEGIFKQDSLDRLQRHVDAYRSGR